MSTKANFGATLQYRQVERDDGGSDMLLELHSVRMAPSLLDGGAPKVTGFLVRTLAQWDLEEFFRLHDEAAAATK